MARTRCTRREKAAEIADFLFVGARRLDVVRVDDCFNSREIWYRDNVADQIEAFLRPWKPTMAARKKTRKVEAKQ